MTVYAAKELKNWDVDTPDPEGGPWIPARPIVLWRLQERLSAGWKVFTGKYDAIDWEG